MSADYFVIWGDPTKPSCAEIDESSFVSLKDAEDYVTERICDGETRRASIFKLL